MIFSCLQTCELLIINVYLFSDMNIFYNNGHIDAESYNSFMKNGIFNIAEDNSKNILKFFF